MSITGHRYDATAVAKGWKGCMQSPVAEQAGGGRFAIKSGSLVRDEKYGHFRLGGVG